MSLDDKLREILDKFTVKPLPDDKYYRKGQDHMLAQIKQAFADEGYAVWSNDAGRLLTGQEFYDRFTKEYITLVKTLKDKDLAAFLGAKRAAGLEATDE